MSFLENNFFLLAVTFGVFFFAKLLQKKIGLVLLNPILLTIAVLIIFLKMTGISYETYNKGGHLIEFWLRPAVVALGVPLYLQLEMIKKQLLPILLSQLEGCIVGVIDCEIYGGFPRSYPVSRPEIGDYPDCDGSDESHRRYSVTDCGGCSGSRIIGSYLRF